MLMILSGGLLATAVSLDANAETERTVLLQVSGASVERSFSLDQLDALPQQKFTTTTIWTVGPMEYSGPALADVLIASGIAGGVMQLQAANEYSVLLDPSMIDATTPIVATRINGRTFDLRERGPLWLVFPYDTDTRFRTESFFAVSIWQLTKVVSVVGP